MALVGKNQPVTLYQAGDIIEGKGTTDLFVVFASDSDLF